MSLINEYRATEEAIKELQERLKNLSQDDKLKKELEFEGKLRSLMAEYQKSLRDITALLDPESAKAGKAARGAAKRCPASWWRGPYAGRGWASPGRFARTHAIPQAGRHLRRRRRQH